MDRNKVIDALKKCVKAHDADYPNEAISLVEKVIKKLEVEEKDDAESMKCFDAFVKCWAEQEEKPVDPATPKT